MDRGTVGDRGTGELAGGEETGEAWWLDDDRGLLFRIAGGGDRGDNVKGGGRGNVVALAFASSPVVCGCAVRASSPFGIVLLQCEMGGGTISNY